MGFFDELIKAIKADNGEARKTEINVDDVTSEESRDDEIWGENEPFNPFEEPYKEADVAASVNALGYHYENPFSVFVLKTVYGTAYLVKVKEPKDISELKGFNLTKVEETEDPAVLKKTNKDTCLGLITRCEASKLEDLLIPVKFVGYYHEGECQVGETEDMGKIISSLMDDFENQEEEFEWPEMYYTVVPGWKNAEIGKYVTANTSFYVYDNEDNAKENYYSKKWLSNGGTLYKCQVAKKDIKTTLPEYKKVAADVLVA